MQLKIYKLTELAKLEGVHYQTALKRAKSGKYVCLTFPISHPGRGKKETKRYLPLRESRKIIKALQSSE